MSREHANAVLALAQAIPNINVYDTQAPAKPPLPYAVLRFDSGQRDRTAITANSNMVTTTVTCTAVGNDRGQSQGVAERVADALVDVRPTVAGRSCSPIEHLDTRPSQMDSQVTPPLFYAVDVFRFVSVT